MNKHTHGQMCSVHNTHQTFISGRAFLFDQDQFIHLPALRLSTYASLNPAYRINAKPTLCMPRPRDQNPAKLALAIGRLEEWKHTPGLGHVMHGNTDNEEYFMTNTFI